MVVEVLEGESPGGQVAGSREGTQGRQHLRVLVNCLMDEGGGLWKSRNFSLKKPR